MTEDTVALALATTLEPLIDQRADVLGLAPPGGAEEASGDVRHAEIFDSYRPMGFGRIVATSGRMYRVVARTDAWFRNRYYQVMLLHWDVIDIFLDGTTEHTRGWATLRQEHPSQLPSVADCLIEEGPRAEAEARYERIANEIKELNMHAIEAMPEGTIR